MNPAPGQIAPSDTDDPARRDSGTAGPAPSPPAGIVWLMRGLAMAALATAAFLTWVHLAGRWTADASAAPLCGGPSWLDCASVLNSRWAAWFGLPVAALAVGVYAVMTLALFGVGPGASVRLRRVCWTVLLAGGMAATVAAGWFVYVQAAVVQRWCSWCTFEHGLGLMLAVLIFVYSSAALPKLAAVVGIIVGLAGGGSLVAGQWLNPPRYTEPVAWSTVGESYREPLDNPADAVTLFGGRIVLDASAHPRLGRSDASRYFVEVVDFTCHRCAKLAPLIRNTLETLGPDTAAIVVFSPLNRDCNRHVPRTNPAYEHACAIARIAAASWLADRTAYGDVHRWLMANQAEMTPAKAKAYAAQRIGGAAIDEALADPRVDQLIARDVELTAKLDPRGLPGLIAGDTRFRALPTDPRELARLIRKAWASRQDQSTPDANTNDDLAAEHQKFLNACCLPLDSGHGHIEHPR